MDYSMKNITNLVYKYTLLVLYPFNYIWNNIFSVNINEFKTKNLLVVSNSYITDNLIEILTTNHRYDYVPNFESYSINRYSQVMLMKNNDPNIDNAEQLVGCVIWNEHPLYVELYRQCLNYLVDYLFNKYPTQSFNEFKLKLIKTKNFYNKERKELEHKWNNWIDNYKASDYTDDDVRHIRTEWPFYVNMQN